MNTKNFFFVFSFAIIFIAALGTLTIAQSPCPNYNDLLDKGWAALLSDPHNPLQANHDEFGTVDSEPFIIKVNDYPPVKSFPIIPHGECSSNTFYYFSFDTDYDYLPINIRVGQNEENLVKTYKVNQGGTYVSGCSLIVTPPTEAQVGTNPDFVMNYDGTMHDVKWDPPSIYPWENIVQNVVSYIPQGLSVVMNGVDNLNYNSSAEFIADIDGGGGNYLIVWSIKNLPGGDWVEIKGNYIQQNYYNIYGNAYIFYDDEYKYNLTMPDNDIELKVEIYDYVTSDYVFATKVVTVNPEAVTFINHIETSENYGELILNENHSDPISSGNNRDLIFGNNYTIRTNELPFLVDWNSTGKTEKQYLWELTSPTLYKLNRDFTFEGTTEQTMKSRFQSTEAAAIKTLIDGVELSGLNLKFNDPWFYYKDVNNNWYQSDVFLPYTSPLEMYNNSPTSYGGIFLNQLVQDGIFYSVQAPLTQTVNLGGSIGTRTFYFQNWSATNASLQQVGSNPPGYDQKAVVFTSTGATVNANLKGQLMSNDQNGISSGSQRKLVRTDNGRYHCVYESMGSVWYTYSLTSNFNGEWSNDKELNSGKNPSIDYEGNNIKIVFEKYLPPYDPYPTIYLETYAPDISGNYIQTETEQIAICSTESFGNAKPVISYDNLVVFIAYRKDITGGIYQKSKWYVGGSWDWGSEGLIPNTNSYSINPTVAGKSNNIYFAYEHNLSIKYIFVYHQGQNWQYSNYTALSKGSGYDINQFPSISVAGSVNPVVSWVGHSNIIPPDRMGKENRAISDKYIPKVVVQQRILWKLEFIFQGWQLCCYYK